jgi:hypothetical protein
VRLLVLRLVLRLLAAIAHLNSKQVERNVEGQVARKEQVGLCACNHG